MIEVQNPQFTQEHTVIERNSRLGDGHNNYLVFDAHDGTAIESVSFQNGATKENGVNGLFNEDVLLMVIDRLEYFQTTEFACPENEQALKYLYEAVKVLRTRTERRRATGKLGTNSKEED